MKMSQAFSERLALLDDGFLKIDVSLLSQVLNMNGPKTFLSSEHERFAYLGSAYLGLALARKFFSRHSLPEQYYSRLQVLCSSDNLCTMFDVLFSPVVPVCDGPPGRKEKAQCLEALIGMLAGNGYDDLADVVSHLVITKGERPP